MVLGEVMVSVNDLSVDYVEFSRTRRNPLGKMRGIKAIEGITFSVDEGDIIALIGKNGAGQSTLLKTTAGQLRPSSGEIHTRGRVILFLVPTRDSSTTLRVGKTSRSWLVLMG